MTEAWQANFAPSSGVPNFGRLLQENHQAADVVVGSARQGFLHLRQVTSIILQFSPSDRQLEMCQPSLQTSDPYHNPDKTSFRSLQCAHEFQIRFGHT